MVANPTNAWQRFPLSRAVLLALIAGAALLATTAASANAVTLKGSIQLTKGATSGPTPYAGSWVSLYETANPSVYFTNPSSPAADQNYTPLVNGTQGVDLGLPVQGIASPAFDGGGNSLTDTILTPEPFAGVNFSSYVVQNTAKKAKIGKKGLVVQVAGGSSARTNPRRGPNAASSHSTKACSSAPMARSLVARTHASRPPSARSWRPCRRSFGRTRSWATTGGTVLRWSRCSRSRRGVETSRPPHA